MWQGSGSVGWDRDGDGDEDDGDLGGDLRKPIEVLVGTGCKEWLIDGVGWNFFCCFRSI